MAKVVPKTLLAFALVALGSPAAAWAQCVGLGRLVDGVEASLEDLRDMSADFVQVQEDALNQTSREEGHLYLRRPRMMRWEYQEPEEKLFVTDGSTVYFYAPADRQVNRDSVGDAFDDRIPIMFLLGRSNLEQEFTRIVSVAETEVPGACGMRMSPLRESEIQEVRLEVDPDSYDIRRLVFRLRDGSVQDLIFSEVRINSGLDGDLFDFVPPPGVRIVEGIGN